MRTGQIIGSTTRDGGEADDRPVTFQEVFATLYHSIGIDVNSATVNDLNGRPRYLVDQEYKPTHHDRRTSMISSKLSQQDRNEPSWVKMLNSRNEAMRMNKRYEDHKHAYNPSRYDGPADDMM